LKREEVILLEIVNRILEVAKSQKISDQAICRILGAHRNKVDDWKKGKSSPTNEEVVLLAEHFGKSIEYLLTGKSPRGFSGYFGEASALDMISELEEAKKVELRNARENDVSRLLEVYEAEERIPVPRYNAVRAGFGGVTFEGLVGYEFFDKSSINDHLTEEYFCIQVRGNSMAPHLIEGDIVLVKRQEDVDSGQVAVVVVDGEEATIKKVKKGRDYIELISANPAYDSRIIEVDHLNQIRIVGRIVESKRKW
jgi:repressor LexA